MIETTVAEVRQLVQEGKAAALAGDTLTARASFRRAAEVDPCCVDALLGLSSTVPVLAEKREYLQRVLALDPANAEAQASLRYVEKLIAEGMRLAPTRSRAELAPAAEPTVPAATPAVEYCYRHPEHETGLRCIQCNQPICGRCSRVAPVGQMCPICRQQRRPQQYQVSTANLIAAGLVTLVVSALAAVLLQFILGDGFVGFYVIFFAGPLAGELIVRITDKVTRAKRGRPMQLVVGGAMALGVLPFALLGRLLVFLLAAAPLAEDLGELPITGALLLSQVNGLLIIFMLIAIATAAARLK